MIRTGIIVTAFLFFIFSYMIYAGDLTTKILGFIWFCLVVGFWVSIYMEESHDAEV